MRRNIPSTVSARCFWTYIFSMSSSQFFSTTSRLKESLWVSSPCASSSARGSTWKATTRSNGARKRFAEATSEDRSSFSAVGLISRSPGWVA